MRQIWLGLIAVLVCNLLKHCSLSRTPNPNGLTQTPPSLCPSMPYGYEDETRYYACIARSTDTNTKYFSYYKHDSPPSTQDLEHNYNQQPFPTDKGCFQHSVALSRSPEQFFILLNRNSIIQNYYCTVNNYYVSRP